MPILKDFRKTQKITLSQYEGSEIEVYDGFLFKDYNLVQGFHKDTENTVLMVKVLSLIIKSWNFTDEAGDVLPISETSLELIKPEALIELVQKITSVVSDKKKE